MAKAVPTETRNISQPADWWAAFEAKARKLDKKLSVWLGELAYDALSPAERKGLSDRRPAGNKLGRNGASGGKFPPLGKRQVAVLLRLAELGPWPVAHAKVGEKMSATAAVLDTLLQRGLVSSAKQCAPGVGYKGYIYLLTEAGKAEAKKAGK